MKFKTVFFYLPFMYAVGTRYNSPKNLIRFILKYLVPVVLLSVFSDGFNIWILLVGIIYTYNLYECGYIENDCETIKNEENPTLRLTLNQLEYYEKYKWRIYTTRFFWHILLFCLLMLIGGSLVCLVYAMLLTPIYLLYNRIRNKWNMLLYMLQMYLRYSAPVFLSINEVSLQLAIMILLIYPYPTYVQRTVKGCFGYISRFYQNYVIASYSDIHLFRRKYYISLFVLSIFCYIINIIEWQLLPSVIYMMVFTSYSCYKHYEQLHSRSRQKQMEMKAKI